MSDANPAPAELLKQLQALLSQLPANTQAQLLEASSSRLRDEKKKEFDELKAKISPLETEAQQLKNRLKEIENLLKPLFERRKELEKALGMKPSVDLADKVAPQKSAVTIVARKSSQTTLDEYTKAFLNAAHERVKASNTRPFNTPLIFANIVADNFAESFEKAGASFEKIQLSERNENVKCSDNGMTIILDNNGHVQSITLNMATENTLAIAEEFCEWLATYVIDMIANVAVKQVAKSAYDTNCPFANGLRSVANVSFFVKNTVKKDDKKDDVNLSSMITQLRSMAQIAGRFALLAKVLVDGQLFDGSETFYKSLKTLAENKSDNLFDPREIPDVDDAVIRFLGILVAPKIAMTFASKTSAELKHLYFSAQTRDLAQAVLKVLADRKTLSDSFLSDLFYTLVSFAGSRFRKQYDEKKVVVAVSAYPCDLKALLVATKETLLSALHKDASFSSIGNTGPFGMYFQSGKATLFSLAAIGPNFYSIKIASSRRTEDGNYERLVNYYTPRVTIRELRQNSQNDDENEEEDANGATEEHVVSQSGSSSAAAPVNLRNGFDKLSSEENDEEEE